MTTTSVHQRPSECRGSGSEPTKAAFRPTSNVTQNGEGHFKEDHGNTVYRPRRTHGLWTNARMHESIVVDSLTGSQAPIGLNVRAYSAVRLSENDLSLGIQDSPGDCPITD